MGDADGGDEGDDDNESGNILDVSGHDTVLPLFLATMFLFRSRVNTLCA